MDSDHGPWFPSIFFVSVLVVNLISAYVFIPRLQKTIAGSAPATDEQPEQVQSTPAIPWAKEAPHHPAHKMEWLPAIDACVGVFFSFFALIDAFFTAHAADSPVYATRWSAFLPYAEGNQGIFPAPWVIGVLCIVSFLLYRKAIQPLLLMSFVALIPVVGMYASPRQSGYFLPLLYRGSSHLSGQC